MGLPGNREVFKNGFFFGGGVGIPKDWYLNDEVFSTEPYLFWSAAPTYLAEYFFMSPGKGEYDLFTHFMQINTASELNEPNLID